MSAAAMAVSAARDWSLESGERQTARVYGDVKFNHRVRYEWAAETLGDRPTARGLDVFCGTGYGTQLVARRTRAAVDGVDGSAESIAFARAHFDHARIVWIARAFPFASPVGGEAYDFIVSLESIEHVEDAAGFFATLARSLAPGGTLLLSTPNERLCPLAEFRNRFHVRHFTFAEVTAMADANGLDLVDWYGQNIGRYRPGVRGDALSLDAQRLTRHTEGQNLVFHFRAPVRRGG